MKLPVNNLKVDDINKHFLIWRMNRAKQQSKVLRGATIKGDLVAISGFLSWCYRKGYRQKKIEGLTTQLLSKN